MNMKEKIARVLIRLEWENTDKACCSLTKEEYELYHWESKKGEAKAALEALLEPTKDMIDAVTIISIELEGKVPHHIAYEAYIKTALED